MNNYFAETGLDKTLPYISVLMEKTDAAHYPKYALPDGYRFTFYEPGMEEDFCKLQCLIGGVDSVGIGRNIFMREFSQDMDTLKIRMIYVIAPDGECAGTACLWWGSHLGDHLPRIHWVTVHPAHQNKGLSKAMLTRLFELHNALGLGPYIYLITQTWSYKAINIYTEYGFNPLLQEKAQHLVPDDRENENSLAWNLIFDKIEMYETAKREGKR